MKTLSSRLSPLAVALLFAQPALAQGPAREVAAPTSLAPLVESVKAAVVNVDTQARPSGRSGGEEWGPDLFEHYFGGGRGRQPLLRGAGSGFIIDSKGLVLTNNHVIDQAVAIRVRLDDGRAWDAQVLGRDPLTDVALLKLKGKVENLPVAKLGDSNAVRPGDWVVAIGNPFGLASSVSVGIISARAREIGTGPYDEFLQTDAAINPGNSGGPLFNMKGEVIGINTLIAGRGTGIGFAVPSNLAKALLPQLERSGTVTRGWLGVGIQDLSALLAAALKVPANEGAVVTSVNPGSPAHKAGLKEDDVILKLDGEKISSGGDLSRRVALRRPESAISLSVYRAGKPQEVKVVLGTRPDFEGVGAPVERGEAGERQQKIGLVFQDMDLRLAKGGKLPTEGALITEVHPGSPAERAELKPGLVVVEAGGKPVRGAEELTKAIRAGKPGSVLLLRVHEPTGGKGLRALQLP